MQSTQTSIWSVIKTEYKILKVLGTGTFGKVVKANQISTDKTVAIKMISCDFENLYNLKKVLREISILR